MKKKIGIALSLMMSISLINADVSVIKAEDNNQEITEYSNSIIDSGTCGDNATYTFTDDGTLTISGTGAMNGNFISPWREYKDKITKVIIKNGITSIDQYAFSGCVNLTNIDMGDMKIINEYAFFQCENLKSVDIPDSVTSIAGGSFYCCTNLKSVFIGTNVEKISNHAFDDCSSLITIDVDYNNKYFSSYDGILYGKNMKTLIKCPEGKKSVSIYKTTTTLGEQSFARTYKLSSITVPSNVLNIERDAFVFSNIKEIKLSEGLKNLAVTAFSQTVFQSITIPQSVIEIGNCLFGEGDSNTIVYVYKNSYGEKYAKENNLKYKVLDQNILPTSVKLNATSKTIQKGKTYTLVPTITPNNTTSKTVTYSSSNKKVATVTSTGTVKAVNDGTAVITVKTSNGLTTTCKVTVPYTVKYNLNGGTNNKANPTSYYGKKLTLQNSTRKGYVFAGWYSDSKYKTKITSFSSGNKVLYAKWSKVTVGKNTVKLVNNSTNKIKITYGAISKVKGYQIQYATNNKFTGSKTKTTTSRSYTLTSLTKGKRYYVRVRGYKIDSTGNKVYGTWSAVKNIKISK